MEKGQAEQTMLSLGNITPNEFAMTIAIEKQAT